MIKAVIFDSDGTLVNTTRLIIEGFKETLREFGYAQLATDHTVRANIGGHIPIVFSNITGLDSNSLTIQEMVIRLDLIQDKIASKTIEPYPKERETLQALKHARVQLGLFTSGTIYQVNRNFSAVGIDYSVIFDAIVTFEDNLPSKPSPIGLLACSDKLGVDIGECIFVGDHTVDIEAGKNAAAGKVIGVSHGFHRDKELLSADPDAIIHNLDELLEHID